MLKSIEQKLMKKRVCSIVWCSFLTFNSDPHDANHKTQLMHVTDFIRISWGTALCCKDLMSFWETALCCGACAAKSLCLSEEQRYAVGHPALRCRDAKTLCLLN